MGEAIMKESRKQVKGHFSRMGWYFMLSTLVLIGVQYAISAVIMIFAPGWLENNNIVLLLSMGSMYLLGLPLLILLLKTLPARTPKKHTMSPGQIFTAAVMSYGLMYVSNYVGIILTTVVGIIRGTAVENVIANVANSSNIFLTFVFMVLCAPVYEEYIFRKLIVDRTVHYGEGIAIFLSGLMFALFHGNLNQFVYAFTLGCFWAFLYVKTGNLKITILLHMIINFLGGIVSVLVTKLADLEALAQISSGDFASVLQLMQENAFGLIIYFLYAGLAVCAAIAGVVLLLVYRKRFRLDREKEAVLSGVKCFSAALLNSGMAAYIIFWFAMIVLQLFGVTV